MNRQRYKVFWSGNVLSTGFGKVNPIADPNFHVFEHISGCSGWNTTVIASDTFVFIAGLCLLIWHYFKKIYGMTKIGDDKREYQYTCIHNLAPDEVIQLIDPYERTGSNATPFFSRCLKHESNRTSWFANPFQPSAYTVFTQHKFFMEIYTEGCDVELKLRTLIVDLFRSEIYILHHCLGLINPLYCDKC